MEPQSSPDAPQLSVIVPCFNEERTLPGTLARLTAYLTGRYRFEIIVVDDGSSDGTVAVAEREAHRLMAVRVLRGARNFGKGHAVARGMAEARGDALLFSDADLSTPVEELERFMPMLARGYGVVIGSRAVPGSHVLVHQAWARERAGRFMNVCVRLATGLPFHDTQCGFKLFSRAAAADVFPNLTVRGWMFDVETLVIARRLGYQVAELPVTWVNAPGSRVKAGHALRIFRDLWHVRRHWVRREPVRARYAVPMSGRT